MKRVLIVDDSPVIRKVARRILESMRLEVREVDTAAAGLDACRSAMPDAVFLDWSIPETDGCDIIRTIRRMPGGEHPKIVFCLTENDLTGIARAMNAGATDYILKPFDRQIMVAKFEQIGLAEHVA
jgi:two-component system chemotaxis response regulator CheY